ncbi:MAG: BsaWI family type II restriction enzyme [Chloroflexota bacterium]
MKYMLHDPRAVYNVQVEIEGVSLADYQDITNTFATYLKEKTQARAIADGYLHALRRCPKANPADLWWHVIYQYYLKQYSDQSWKRAAGFALEWAFVGFYQPLLEPFGVHISVLTAGKAVRVLEEMGIVQKVGKSKLDIILEGECPGGSKRVFGGIHVKSSLAERIQDDVPASLAMMEKGYWSGFVTLDAKAFPPPHGDGVVRGELGLRSDPAGALKRNYFERDGQFDNCYSYNLRTIPSGSETSSGKRIYTLSFSDTKPDQFMRDVLERWELVKQGFCTGTITSTS